MGVTNQRSFNTFPTQDVVYGIQYLINILDIYTVEGAYYDHGSCIQLSIVIKLMML